MSESNPPTAFAGALTELRGKHEMEWPAFADLIGVDGSTLNSWLSGNPPSQPIFNQLVDRLGTTLRFNVAEIDVVVESYDRDINLRFSGGEVTRSTAPVKQPRRPPPPYMLSRPVPTFAEMLEQMRGQQGVTRQVFAKLLGVDDAMLSAWLSGDVPQPPSFNKLVRNWLLDNLLDADTSRLLVESYNQQAYPQVIEEDRDQAAVPVKEHFKIRRAPPPYILARLPTFATALEQIRVDHDITWSEFSAQTSVRERTLRSWLQGVLPRPSSLQKLLEHGRNQQILSEEERSLLSQNYNNDVERQVRSQISVEATAGAVRLNEAEYVAANNAYASVLREVGPPPSLPKQTSPGPTLRPTSAGFDIAIQPPPETERDDPELQRLHQQLRRLADRLATSMPRISNTHKELADEFAAYLEFLTPNLIDLDITSFWAVGTGLGAHIRALNRAGSNVMAPELEPALIGQFETLMAVHAAFILGFSAAREMQARIAQARAAAQDDPDLSTRVQSVLTSMVETPHLLANKARSLVVSLIHGIPAAPDGAFDLLAGRYETARNGTHAFMRAIHPLIEVTGVMSVLSFGNAVLSGEQVDLMLTTGTYIYAHMPEIMSLFQNDQSTTDWLKWAHRRLQRET